MFLSVIKHVWVKLFLYYVYLFFCLSVQALTFLNVLGLSQSWSILFIFIVQCFIRNMEFAAFKVHLQGHSK